jgi:copper transport protein
MSSSMPGHTNGTPNRTGRRWCARAAAVGGIVLVALGLGAAPASAHAVLLDTSPNPGQVLDHSPSQILLRFNESVDAGLGAIRLYDHAGARRDLSLPVASDRDVVVVNVPERLGDGAYVVTWRVISADSHPVRGGFTFQIGTAANAGSKQIQGLTRRLVDQQSGNTTVGVLYAIARGGVFGGLAALMGGSLFLTLIARGTDDGRGWRVVRAAWVVSATSTFGGLLLLGPYGSGEGVTKVFDPDLLREVLDARYGQAWAARLVLLVLAWPVLRRLLDASAPRSRRLLGAAGALALGLAATITLSGHATSGRWVAAAIPIDLVHVLAMSCWLGGLLCLAAAVLPSRALAELRTLLPQFSRLALTSVAVLAVTGAFQSWRQVGSLDALRDTDYGRLLIIKAALVAIVILFAYRSRGVVQRLAIWLAERRAPEPALVAGGSDDDLEPPWFEEQVERRILRNSVIGEVAVAVAVIVVTALLVNAVPARTANSFGAQGATGVTLKSRAAWVDVTVAPGRTGANSVHVFVLRPDGAPLGVQQITLTIELRSRNIGPIDVPLRHISNDHDYSPGFEIPIAGTWRVTAKIVVTQFDERTLTGAVVIR